MQPSQKSAAEYIGDLATQLGVIAKAHKLLTLAYVLNMAAEEAHGFKPGPGVERRAPREAEPFVF
jgi:hypothetical protein